MQVVNSPISGVSVSFRGCYILAASFLFLTEEHRIEITLGKPVLTVIYPIEKLRYQYQPDQALCQQLLQQLLQYLPGGYRRME